MKIKGKRTGLVTTALLLGILLLVGVVVAPPVSALPPGPTSLQVNINGQLSICHHPPNPCDAFTATLEAHADGTSNTLLGMLVLSPAHGAPHPPQPCIASLVGMIITPDPTAVESVRLNGILVPPGPSSGECSGGLQGSSISLFASTDGIITLETCGITTASPTVSEPPDPCLAGGTGTVIIHAPLGLQA